MSFGRPLKSSHTDHTTRPARGARPACVFWYWPVVGLLPLRAPLPRTEPATCVPWPTVSPQCPQLPVPYVAPSRRPEKSACTLAWLPVLNPVSTTAAICVAPNSPYCCSTVSLPVSPALRATEFANPWGRRNSIHATAWIAVA